MRKKSEAILDFILAFIGVAILTLGISRIWVWFNINYAGQQVTYQRSRLLAGSPKQFLPTADERANKAYNAKYEKVIGTAASTKCPSCWNKPLDLTEDWVFKGTPGAHNTYGGLGLGAFGLVGSIDCEAECTEENNPGNGCGNAKLIDEIDPATGTCVLIDDPKPDIDPAHRTHTHQITINDPDHPGRRITVWVPNKICKKIRDPDAIINQTDTFNPDCPCFIHCDCVRRNALTLEALKQQVFQLCGIRARYIAYIDWKTGIRNLNGNPRPVPNDGSKVTKIRFYGCGGESFYQQDSTGRWSWSPLPDAKALCNICIQDFGGDYVKAGCSKVGGGFYDPGEASLYDRAGHGPLTNWCGQVCQLCANAKGMEDAAEGCCDPWDMCWWFTWGKACDPLKKAAKQLRLAAREIADEGRRLQYEIYKIEECCNEPMYDTLAAQNACLEGKSLFHSCDDVAGKIREIQDEIDALTGAKTLAYDSKGPQAIVRPNPATGQIGCRDFLHPPANETVVDMDWVRLFLTDAQRAADPNAVSPVGSIDMACKLQQEIGYSLDYSNLNYKWEQSCDCGDCTDTLSFGGCSVAPAPCLASQGKTTINVDVPKRGYGLTTAVTASGATPVCVWTASDKKPIAWRRITDAKGVYDDGTTTVPRSYITCMNTSGRSPWWNKNIRDKILNQPGRPGVVLTEVWKTPAPPGESDCVLRGALTGVPMLGVIADNCGIASIWRCTIKQIGQLWEQVFKFEKEQADVQACCAAGAHNPPPPATIAGIKADQCKLSNCNPSVATDCSEDGAWQKPCIEQVVDQLQKECVTKAQQGGALTGQAIYCSGAGGSEPESECGEGLIKVTVNIVTQPCWASCAATWCPTARFTDKGSLRTYCFTFGQLRCFYNCIKGTCGYAGTMPGTPLPALMNVKIKETDTCGVGCADANFRCADFTFAGGWRTYSVSQAEASAFWGCYSACPVIPTAGDRPCGGCVTVADPKCPNCCRPCP